MPFVKPLRCYCIVLIQKTLNDGRYLNCLVQYLSSSRAKSLILCRFFSHSFSCSVLLLTKLQKSIIKTAVMPLSNSLYSTILLSIPCQIYLCPIFGVYFTIWNPLLAQFHCIYFGCFRQLSTHEMVPFVGTFSTLSLQCKCNKVTQRDESAKIVFARTTMQGFNPNEPLPSY